MERKRLADNRQFLMKKERSLTFKGCKQISSFVDRYGVAL